MFFTTKFREFKASSRLKQWGWFLALYLLSLVVMGFFYGIQHLLVLALK